MTFVHNPPTWIKIFVAVSTIAVLLDSSYLLLRPYTLIGGGIFELWSPWRVIYSKIDFSYSWAAYQAKDGFPGAQATMCLVESALNITYLYLLSSSKGGDAHITAALVGFTSMVMIESKTALYWLIEAFNGMKHIGHNEPLILFGVWVAVNGPWLVFPAIIARYLWKDISRAMRGEAGKVKSK